MSKPSAPAAPDYTGAANATSQGSLQATIANALLNRSNQSNPYGSQTWQQTGTSTIPGVGTNPAVTVPNFSSSINLTPQGQQLFDLNQQQAVGLGNAANTSLGQATSALSSPLDTGSAMPAYNQQVADALYNRSTRYLDPQWANAADQNNDRLVNAGFSIGDEGYNRAQTQFANQKDSAYAGARDTAIQQAGTIGLQQRQQDIAEKLLQRTQPLTELNALRTGAAPQVPSFPSTNVGASAQGPNLLGAAQGQAQSANDIYNAQTGTYNSQIGAAGSLLGYGGTALAMGAFF